MFSKAAASTSRWSPRATAPSAADFGLAGALVSALRLLLSPRAAIPPPALSLEARLPLGGTRAALLIACHGHRYLLGASSESLFLIGEVSADVQAEGLPAMPEERP